MEVQLELGILAQWGPRIGGSDSNYPAINWTAMIHLRDGNPAERKHHAKDFQTRGHRKDID